jgi:hypothetical protein
LDLTLVCVAGHWWFFGLTAHRFVDGMTVIGECPANNGSLIDRYADVVVRDWLHEFSFARSF